MTEAERALLILLAKRAIDDETAAVSFVGAANERATELEKLLAKVESGDKG